MKKIISLFIITSLLSGHVCSSQNAEIISINSSFSKIVDKDARIEKISDGFQFLEGPVWHKDGYLLFSDIPANKIYRYDPGKGVSVYLENSGYVSTDEENKGQGSNGLTFDNKGNLLICQHGARQLLEVDKDGSFRPIARQFKGKRLNSPNDAVAKSDGTIFFTDPPWGLAKGIEDPAKELDFQGVYRLKNGSLELLDDQLAMPNGIALSPKEDLLYVANSNNGKAQYHRYQLNESGDVVNKELFFDASDLTAKGSPDGMKVDKKGNCYFTGPGGVLVVTPKGEHIGTITPPEAPANVGWGGKDGKTLFMTCRTGLYAIKLKIEGIRPMM
jgi:gluconolactonase